MESSKITFPVIDLEQANIKMMDDEIDIDTLKHIGKDIVKALVEVGFFYIKNHGVEKKDIDACSEAGKKFFDLPDTVKLARLRNTEENVWGYIPIPGLYGDDMPSELFDLSKPADHKEAIILSQTCDPSIWPDKELPKFKTTTMSIFEQGHSVTSRLLLLIGYGLTPDTPKCFQDGFKKYGTEENTTAIKFARYVPAAENTVESGAMRCGEHTDLGLITLLFLDSTPGLQIFLRQDKCYKDVDFKEDTILVNIGDLFQRWTSDVLHAGKHQVIFRPDTVNRERFSLLYFATPDNEAVIGPVVEPLDQYPPIRTIDYFNRRVEDIYIKHEGFDSELHIEK